MSHLEAYHALLRLPTDPKIAGKIGHHLTAPANTSAERRVAEYLHRATMYLMHRDLARDGDI